MSDPFQPPDESPPPRTPGTLDIGEALLTSVYGLGRNALTWAVTVIGALVVYVVSICTCIGWIFVIPPLFWTFYRMAVETVRGETSFDALSAGVENYLTVLARVWGFMLIMGLLAMPGVLLLAAGLFGYYGLEGLAEPDPMTNVWLTGASSVMTLGFIALFARLQLVPFLLVDRDLPVIESFSESWRITEGNWLRLIGLQYFVMLWSLPATTVQTGVQYYIQTQPPVEQLSLLFPQMGVSLLTSLWALLLGLINLCALAAAYQQLGEPGDAA